MFNYEQFHDGAFEGLLIDDRTVHVFISTAEKEQFVLTASAVAALTANGIRVGNIIFDIETWTAEELTSQDIRDVFGYHQSSKEDAHANNALARAKKARLSLLAINPSYGGNCLLLAESIALVSRREWSVKSQTP